MKKIITTGLALLLCMASAPTAFASYSTQAKIPTGTEVKFQFLDNVYVQSFSEGMVSISLPTGEYGYIDKNEVDVVPPKYSLARNFKEGFAVVEYWEENSQGDWRNNTRSTFINKAGKEIIKPTYNYIGDFSEGRAVVRKGKYIDTMTFKGNYGYIDTKGNVVHHLKWEDASSFSNGMAAVKRGGLWGYIDKQGTLVIQNIFEEAGEFQNGLAVVSQNGKYGVIDKTGKFVVQPIWSAIVPNDNYSLFAVRDQEASVHRDYTTEDTWGVVNNKGKIIAEPIYQDISISNCISVKQNGLWGVIDSSGKTIIKPMYHSELMGSKYNDLIGFCKNGKWGYINSNNQVIIPPKYNFASEFDKNGVAHVQVGSTWGLINTKGNFVLEPNYQELNINDDNTITARYSNPNSGSFYYTIFSLKY